MFVSLCKFVLCIILFATLTKAKQLDGHLVRTTYGILRGRSIVTEELNSGTAFMGIPYAEPPLGDLRFRPPQQLVTPWSGIRDAREYGAACMANSSFTTEEPDPSIDEDCLTLNVFTTGRCNKFFPCPVIYYIHGGGWEEDSPRLFPPDLMIDNFASRGVIMVTVGYRLGLFGFWSAPLNEETNDDVPLQEARGNYGVHDIIEGLRWVNAEIGAFGGDKNRVTLMGHSSGAMGSHLVCILPAAHGLFNQCIAMSGVISSSILLPSSNIRQEEMNRDLALSQNCVNASSEYANMSLTDRQSLLRCMRDADAHELIDYQRFYEDKQESNMFIGPTIDGILIDRTGEELLSNQKPHNLLTGITNNEFGFPSLPSSVQPDLDAQLESVCRMAAASMHLNASNHALIDACVTFYRNQTVPPVEGDILTMIGNDIGIVLPAYKAAVAATDVGSNVYLYQFDYSMDTEHGTHHAQDLTYVMGIHPFNYTRRDLIMFRTYPKYFADFAKYGRPTARWQSFSPIIGNYFSINMPPLSKNVVTGFHRESVRFWTKQALAIDVDDHHPQTEIKHRDANPLTLAANAAGYPPGSYPANKSESFPSSWAFIILTLVSLVIIGALVLYIRHLVAKRQMEKRDAQRIGEKQPLFNDQGGYDAL